MCHHSVTLMFQCPCAPPQVIRNPHIHSLKDFRNRDLLRAPFGAVMAGGTGNRGKFAEFLLRLADHLPLLFIGGLKSFIYDRLFSICPTLDIPESTVMIPPKDAAKRIAQEA